MLKVFNNTVRIAMEKVGYYWRDNFLPLHFTPGAVQRYNYVARSDRWQNIKRKAQWVTKRGFVRDGKRYGAGVGEVVPATQPPLPLVWTNELRESVLPGSHLVAKATATSNKVTVRIPIKLPHPMREIHAKELVKINAEENRKLSSMAVQETRRMLAGMRLETRELISA